MHNYFAKHIIFAAYCPPTTTSSVIPPSMKKSYVSVLISVVKLELAAQNILKIMDTG